MRYVHRGSTLIVVLMIVLMITIIGTLAIRQSVSSLKLVSNNQIQTLLGQNADAALMYFQNPDIQQNMASTNGIVGFFKNEDNWNKELVFCFKGTQPFNLSNASWLYWDGATKHSQLMATGGGACQALSSEDKRDVTKFSGGRSQVVTQVHIKKAASTAQPFSDLARGTDVIGAKTENSIRLRVQVTSVMEGLLSNPNSDLFDTKTGCLNKSIELTPEAIEKKETGLVQCLQEKNILYSTQVAEYRFLSDFEPSGS
ncbi:pilus assembly PilX N-terminal domain-containing protein [Acinetobacter sp. NIPH1876]|uniref:pilus assembly PilX family protein n=1 Tax=unclassified Acinetobacter TaxID=196816 RepID=UPI001FAC5423|nr:pilus assembly PilX N-terminal domain-containing protein [Acinetobacter sp. NIPH1876]MCJ0829130.1 pilus assembly PilX N-terminal domain-containing protein [Acinetobacter sp. NIPH1876]